MDEACTDQDADIVVASRAGSQWVLVWDWVVRAFHWSLVASFTIAYLSRHSSEDIHHVAGYAAAGLVVLRLVWGVIGTRHARFTHFVRHPRTVWGYLADILSGREARHLGHNPAGGAMILALMAGMVMTALTGWLMTTDAYFGVAWVGLAHSVFAHGMVILIGLHLAGVALASVRHRENLVRAMVTGRKRRPDAADIA